MIFIYLNKLLFIIFLYFTYNSVNITLSESPFCLYVQKTKQYVLIGDSIGNDSYITLPNKQVAIYFGFTQEDKIHDLQLLSKTIHEIMKLPNRSSIINKNNTIEMFYNDMNYYNNILYYITPLILENQSYILEHSNLDSIVLAIDKEYIIRYDRVTRNNNNNNIKPIESLQLYMTSYHHMNQLYNIIQIHYNNEYHILELFKYIEHYRILLLNNMNIFISFTLFITTTSRNYIDTIGFVMTKVIENELTISLPIILTLEHKNNTIQSIKSSDIGIFEYNNRIMFIHTLHPLQVNEIPMNDSYEIINTSEYFIHSNIHGILPKLISHSECYDDFLPMKLYPNVFASTPLVLLMNQYYLGFYRAKTNGNKNLFDGYEGYPIPRNRHDRLWSIGAYLISNTIPFQLLRISPWPITSKLFESDEYGLDLRPTHFWFEDMNEKFISNANISINHKNWKETFIRLSVSHNDQHVILLKLNLYELIASLRILEC